ncbi:hypothetical protein OCF84_21670 (plasmid) [Shewanella xiamenensis]|uniref:Lipoprotein n=1 Tax=Shewanella xiamenensis TaxID=332186 RepID=A0ABT6UEZ7_9GAMM|nr:hypothetical protein [Shewanella xiamenensis]MDI5832512.1 hypothetical protein [Shewanella xiamenensis]WHF57869.1 hypothetical protein OCF84_21670 [Shewanella xiamenensis]
MRLAFLIVIAFFQFGCGYKNEGVAPEDDANAKPKVLSNCGVTQYDQSSTEFIFSCGLNEREAGLSKDMRGYTIKKEQDCEVYFGEDGQIKTFMCRGKAENIDVDTIEGNWMCSGLDGYGGYYSKNESALSIKSDGNFALHLSAKSNTDSVWHLADSVISGQYSVERNKLVLTPSSWTSELIDKAGLTFDKAPKFMLVEPIYVEVIKQTEKTFSGRSRRVDNQSGILSSVNCERFNFN